MFKSRPNKLALAISCGLLTLTGAVHAQQVNDKEIVESVGSSDIKRALLPSVNRDRSIAPT